jgi:hypothetical protein
MVEGLGLELDSFICPHDTLAKTGSLALNENQLKAISALIARAMFLGQGSRLHCTYVGLREFSIETLAGQDAHSKCRLPECYWSKERSERKWGRKDD